MMECIKLLAIMVAIVELIHLINACSMWKLMYTHVALCSYIAIHIDNIIIIYDIS